MAMLGQSLRQRPNSGPNLEDRIIPLQVSRPNDLSQDGSINQEALAQAPLGANTMGEEKPTRLCQD
jgi:hypothetical protein